MPLRLFSKAWWQLGAEVALTLNRLIQIFPIPFAPWGYMQLGLAMGQSQTPTPNAYATTSSKFKSPPKKSNWALLRETHKPLHVADLRGGSDP